jgi:propanol-preferring alcohol dehydrogenase
VSVAAGYGCGDCDLCRADRENICPRLVIPGISRDGAQATYVVVPARAVVALPDAVDFATGAIVTDAVATPFHAIRRSGVLEGQTAVVYGLGGLGLHAVTILKQVVGARVVGVDPHPGARERARAFGADEVLDADSPAKAVRAMTGGGADVSYEFVGAAAVTDQALKSLRPGGTCTVVGVTPERLALGLPQALLVAGELRLQGSFGCSRAELVELIGLVGDGRLDLSGTITHRYALADFDAALRTLETKDGDPIRVVVEQHE